MGQTLDLTFLNDMDEIANRIMSASSKYSAVILNTEMYNKLGEYKGFDFSNFDLEAHKYHLDEILAAAGLLDAIEFKSAKISVGESDAFGLPDKQGCEGDYGC